MNRFLCFLVFALWFLGCGPALSPRDVCLGECESSASPSQFSVCRQSCVHVARETVVGVEYAGDQGPPSWTCEAAKAFYVRQPDGLIPAKPEVLRVQGQGYPKEAAHSKAIIALGSQYLAFLKAHGIDADDTEPEPRAFLDRRQIRKSNAHRCWYRGHEPHPDVATWLPATWPRKTAITSPGGTRIVPAALAWDPSKGTGSPPANTWTCKGAAYYRLRSGPDLTEVRETVLQRSGLPAPETAAESALRKSILEIVGAAAERFSGRDDAFTLDSMGGQLEPTPIRCWHDGASKPGTPSDWRGPTTW
jgi:hypothetical protein